MGSIDCANEVKEAIIRLRNKKEKNCLRRRPNFSLPKSNKNKVSAGE
uniref:Uncharacterized protein n=1 Tax=Anguilla anguilla TaxID=7936 RepID=A0A0E9V9X4_ANGAN